MMDFNSSILVWVPLIFGEHMIFTGILLGIAGLHFFCCKRQFCIIHSILIYCVVWSLWVFLAK